jgi:TPR repeat protein
LFGRYIIISKGSWFMLSRIFSSLFLGGLIILLGACLPTEQELISDEDAINPFSSRYILISGMRAIDSGGFRETSEGDILFERLEGSNEIFVPYTSGAEILPKYANTEITLKFYKTKQWDFWSSTQRCLVEIQLQNSANSLNSNNETFFFHYLVEMVDDKAAYYSWSNGKPHEVGPLSKIHIDEPNINEAHIDGITADLMIRQFEYGIENGHVEKTNITLQAIDSTRAALHKKLIDNAAQKNNDEANIFFEKGVALIAKGQRDDSVEGLKSLEKASAMGHAKAPFIIYIMYQNGNIAEMPDLTAAASLSRAAKKGHLQAMHLLGHQYYSGTTLFDKDLDKAANVFRKAAELGQLDAHVDYANMLYTGQGVPQDKKSAIEWLRKAVNNNFSYAQYQLGLKLIAKDSPEKNALEANKWFKKAFYQFEKQAAKGDKKAAATYAYMLQKGYGVEQNKRLAFRKYLELAKSGYSSAYISVAFCYLDGTGVPVNQMEARKWLELAKAKGSSLAVKILARVEKNH